MWYINRGGGQPTDDHGGPRGPYDLSLQVDTYGAMEDMTTILKHDDAYVHVEELPTGKNKISVELINDDLFMSTKECETTYPMSLIDKIMDLKGPCYSISNSYVI